MSEMVWRLQGGQVVTRIGSFDVKITSKPNEQAFESYHVTLSLFQKEIRSEEFNGINLDEAQKKAIAIVMEFHKSVSRDLGIMSYEDVMNSPRGD